MVLADVASRSSSDGGRGRGGPPLGLVGLVVLVALVAAYLSDCIPGLGTGGSLGTPQSEATAETKEPTEPTPTAEQPREAEGANTRLSITVQGDKCVRDAAPGAPCPQICAALDRTRASEVTVEVDATHGSHGVVEALRTCLQEAGFSDVRVRSE